MCTDWVRVSPSTGTIIVSCDRTAVHVSCDALSDCHPELAARLATNCVVQHGWLISSVMEGRAVKVEQTVPERSEPLNLRASVCPYINLHESIQRATEDAGAKCGPACSCIVQSVRGPVSSGRHLQLAEA